MTITFETLQSNLQTMLKLADVKVGTKKAIELEHVYVLALRDVAEEGPDARPIREYTKILISESISSKPPM